MNFIKIKEYLSYLKYHFSLSLRNIRKFAVIHIVTIHRISLVDLD